ncbi:hypothetical protein [Laceyella putida]|uniref:Uncharacterized protein n=1 Tax=Laceyella putida TaxID=110101 RepID=A0ABW2RQZ9_9BACL
MFNTDLPSGRRKLFALVLGVFLIVGFSVKYLLIWLGWVGGTETDAHKKPATAPVVQPEPAPPSISPEEVAQAKGVAEQFIRAYTTVDFKKRDVWLASLESLTAPAYYDVLQEEAALARPAEGTLSTSFSKLGRMDCEALESRVSCLAEVVVLEKGENRSLPMERMYQLLLGTDEKQWVVEEVQVRGNFE